VAYVEEFYALIFLYLASLIMDMSEDMDVRLGILQELSDSSGAQPAGSYCDPLLLLLFFRLWFYSF